MWHGSRANPSDRPRRAIALHYITQDCRYVSKGDHPMKPFVKVGEGEKLVGDRFPQVWPALSDQRESNGLVWSLSE